MPKLRSNSVGKVLTEEELDEVFDKVRFSMDEGDEPEDLQVPWDELTNSAKSHFDVVYIKGAWFVKGVDMDDLREALVSVLDLSDKDQLTEYVVKQAAHFLNYGKPLITSIEVLPDDQVKVGSQQLFGQSGFVEQSPKDEDNEGELKRDDFKPRF